MSRIDDALRRAQGDRACPRSVDYSRRGAPRRPTPPAVRSRAWTLPDADAASPDRSSGASACGRSGSRDGRPGVARGLPGLQPGESRNGSPSRPTQSFGLVEQYRKLAATLHHAQIERASRCVMVTSAHGGRGQDADGHQPGAHAVGVVPAQRAADRRRPAPPDAARACSRCRTCPGSRDGLQAPTEQKAVAGADLSPADAADGRPARSGPDAAA